MMIIFDLLLIVLFIFACITGYKKGFSDIALKMIGVILGIILAFVFKDFVSDVITANTTIDDSIYDVMIEKISVENSEATFLFWEFDLQSTVADKAGEVTSFIIRVISFGIIFIVTVLVVFILRKVLDLVFELPIIGDINKILGLIINVILMAFKIFIILLILKLLSPFVPQISDLINDTILISKLYQNNIFNYFFS